MLIDIEMFNKAILEIEKAKNILNSAKPAIPRSYRIGNTGLRLIRDDIRKDGTINTNVMERCFEGLGYNVSGTEAIRNLAICVVKLLGPITQDEINSVVVE